jgi:hypothetical protein
MASQKVAKASFPFRRKPEFRFFEDMQNAWTPIFTGVTSSFEDAK